MSATARWLANYARQYGPASVITDPSGMAPFLTDWRGRYQSQARAILQPSTSEAVAAAVRFCQAERLPLTPQGGNTGLVGGAVSLAAGGFILSTTRLREYCRVDIPNRTLCLSAGFTLQEAQYSAAQAGLLFPLSLASEGSCTIGGNLSTNAGGTAVLCYGNIRDLTLGLEAVLPNGTIWSDLRGLRKSNVGYDLKQLLIGAEGTLGIITGTTLKLFPTPLGFITVWLAVNDIDQAVDVFQRLQTVAGPAVTACEWMNAAAIEIVQTHFAGRAPVSASMSHLLLELSYYDQAQSSHLEAQLLKLLNQVSGAGMIGEAVVAHNEQQRQALWQLRENISAAQARAGLNVKHDIGLPLSEIGAFVKKTAVDLSTRWPGCRPIVFGHLGDGNLHFNVSAPIGADSQAFLHDHEAAINACVHKSVQALGGTISAEHGIGLLKKDALAQQAPVAALEAMRAIKKALDPHNILNPGKIINL
ncbi:MAG: FAD-binding oxidoreductase [Burkholderiaceae bacterium]